MLLSALKIGMIIFCSVHAEVELYQNIVIKNVPTKVQYVDKETGDLFLIHQFYKLNNPTIDVLDESKNVKKHMGEGMLKYCSERRTDV